MEEYIKEIEAYHTREIEAYHTREIEAYLNVTGLNSQELSPEEKDAVLALAQQQWREFNLKELFGPSTRGRRLKSADRIKGSLPFVTAGESCEGISGFIGNEVRVFASNTTTVDMFGSAKYRNYDYGADDHIAVVHTENLAKNAAIFVTAAIHKSAHTGKFNYGRNFYAKDADELNILLPAKGGQPDFAYMDKVISAVTKLVVKDVLDYVDRKTACLNKVLSG